MKHIKFASLAIVTVLAASPSAFSQETQTRVVDEVVAVVNNEVITLSKVKREIKDAVESFVQQGKTREEAQRMVDEKKGELIANLITEELMLQRAKESGIEKDVDDRVNQRLVDIMKQYNLKTVEELYAMMEKSGVDPKDVKEGWRKQETREQVVQRDLQSKVYWEPNGKAVKDYYENHKAKFTKPETISFSELFLGFAGRNEASVREKAAQLYQQLKAGGDWEKLLKDNGDTPVMTQGAGKLENVRLDAMNEKLLNSLKNLKVGEYAAPFELDQMGMAIIRMDAREQASSESVFNENAVRMAMMNERLPDEQKKYMAKLREESYIKISDSYRPIVNPILFADERKDKPAN
ncbi:MAG: peptidyl-prolyl cis-trans isomerase [Chloracidobacterium sp.]|nr:peptidyl-prolyl cis-trans isomerase [Chloracidobacterium sp.]